jgi:hypothetical protein
VSGSRTCDLWRKKAVVLTAQSRRTLSNVYLWYECRRITSGQFIALPVLSGLVIEFVWGCKSSAMWRCVVVLVVSGVSENSAFETSEITDAATQRHFAEDPKPQLYSCENLKFHSLFTACCLDGAVLNWQWPGWREEKSYVCSVRKAVKC